VPSSRAVDTHLNKFPFEMIGPGDHARRGRTAGETVGRIFSSKGQKIQKEAE